MRLRFDFKSDLLTLEPLTFSEPLRVVTAHTVSEVIPALRAVQDAADSGLWAAGYVAYEAASAFDAAMKTHVATQMPLVWFGIYESGVRGQGSGDRGQGTGNRGQGTGKTDSTQVALSPSNSGRGRELWRPGIDRAEYDCAVEAIREAIGRGDLYQANFTFPLKAQFEGDPYSRYLDLLQSSECGYGAFLELDEWSILSASPELFFEFNRSSHTIVTRPMKGTRLRGRWMAEDLNQAEGLSQSEKERAENLMIVDLLRNDLGRIAVPGTVRTPAMFAVEKYPTVWQMTSTITAETRSNIAMVDVFAALFPCGSVTGAPKIAAMQKLTQMEHGPRGVYCGAIGLVKPGGDAVFNVAIRTMTMRQQTGEAAYHVGGGITWDSTAEGEYEEALSKAKVVSEVDPEFDLLETLRLEDGEFHLGQRHIARLQESAVYFGWPLSQPSIESELDGCAAANPVGTWRVRLIANSVGKTSIEAAPLQLVVGNQAYKLAQEAVSSKNRFLFHKTTNRLPYEAAIAECGVSFDVLMFNERGEITEFTRGNVVMEIDGELLTPPLHCGLLPGTMRAELLEAGEIAERVLPVESLGLASKVWFINSVHGWIELSEIGWKGGS